MSELNIYGVGEVQNNSDYIGFTFNGVHSDTLGIKRTSEGSRFNENLLPTIQDKTVQVPGGDGMYHFGSYYTQRQFNISYAFDALTEEQLARIKEVFGDKKIHELIFDEAPYKAYYAKVTGTSSIKHIPFSEGPTNRIYKGEGSIQFTAYDPYAYSVKKFLNEYSNTNKDEWKDASGLLQWQDVYDKTNGEIIALYNPGIKETDFILSITFENNVIPASTLYITLGGKTVGQLSLGEITSQDGDDEIRINSKMNLIEGYKNNKKTGNIYNKFIIAGTFFKIPAATSDMKLIFPHPHLYKNIEYRYIYF